MYISVWLFAFLLILLWAVINTTTKLFTVPIALTKPYSLDFVLFSLFPLWTESSHLYFHTGIYLILSFSHLSFPASMIFLPLQIFLSCLFHDISYRYLYFNTGSGAPVSVPFKYSFQSLYSRTTHKRDGREKEKEEEYTGTSIHHEQLLSFLSKGCLTFFIFCIKMTDFKQRREINMRLKKTKKNPNRTDFL